MKAGRSMHCGMWSTLRIGKIPVTCLLFVLIAIHPGIVCAESKEVVQAEQAAGKMTFQEARSSLLASARQHLRPDTRWDIRMVPGGFAVWGDGGWTAENPLWVMFGNIRGGGIGSKGKFVRLSFKSSWTSDPSRRAVPLWFDSNAAALQFAAAIDWFLLHRGDPRINRLGDALSSEQAAAWIASGSHVNLPDEALRHKVLGDHAFEQRDFQRAADEYEAALQIYPTWPDGQYVCAAIESQLKDYDDAIPHMKAYLELVPNAPNAEKAKEQIWIWQDEQKSISK